MAYEYDPVLCMMVEKPNVKTNDKAGEMWYLYVDGKSITAFENWGAPVKEAKEYMKKNNIKGVGTLKRIGRGGSFTITAKDVDVLKKGQVYRNANGVEVEIIFVEPNYVLVDFGGQKKDFTPYGLQKILSDNGYKKVRDAKAKDVDKYAEKAIKACDDEIRLVKTVASKNGYSVHIVEGNHGKRIVLTFKGESYKNPHMWLGEANESNKKKAIEMMNEFAGR